MERKIYPSDLTDNECAIIEPMLPVPSPRGRPRKWPLRDIVDAILYVVRGGAAWRMMPGDFPPWQTIYEYFSGWRKSGLWQRIYEALHRAVRLSSGRKAQPTAGIICQDRK